MKPLLIIAMFVSSVSASTVSASSVFVSTVMKSNIDTKTYSTSLDFAQVTRVVATQQPDASWCFDTSIRHNDQGWEHYADGWEVLDLEGNQLSSRRLGHPHVNEQPFTRGQCGIKIPPKVTKLIVRAKCNKHGFGGKPIVVDLNNSPSEEYSVDRLE